MEDCERKYKEAFNMAVLEHKSDNEAVRESIERIFPQLKEPEDEKIRKAIISAINNICNGDEGLVTFNGFSKEQVLTWLEKQCDQKSADKCEGCNNAKGCVACVDGSEWAHIEEQKPFDYENANIQQKDFASIEPKFKVGDWVVFNNKHQSIYQVEKIEDGYYILRHTHGGTFRVCVLHDESLRLWTIQDAKDGDVLAALDYILIFKEFLKNDGGISYCHYDFGAGNPQFIWSEDKNWYFGKEAIIHPATKEQRELLFQKMKEEGYEWNAEKKELKKIEPTPAWSEEDEKQFSFCCAAIELSNYSSDEYRNYAISFLKSLKDRVGCEVNCTTTKVWSEDDESNLQGIIDEIEAYKHIAPNYYLATYDRFLSWLKSLKDRVGHFDDGYKVGFSAAKHNQWKPNDEQMKILSIYAGQNNYHGTVLTSLYQDLKKLKG